MGSAGTPAPSPSVSADQVADAFHAAGLGEIRFPAPIVRDGDTTRLVVELCGVHGHTANAAIRARNAIAQHLGVPEEQLAVQHVPDEWRVELVIRGTGTVTSP